MKSPATYSAIEQEIVVLRAAWDMIDGMVNLEMFVRHPEPNRVHSNRKTMGGFCDATDFVGAVIAVDHGRR
jgi:hypothetical protein